MDKRIKKFIFKTRIWIFIKNLVNNILWSLGAGCGVAMIFEIIAYFRPWYNVHFFSSAVVILSMIIAFVCAFVKFPSDNRAAKELDNSGLMERAQTAVELLGKTGSFADMQKRDAYRAMLGDKIPKMIPLRVNWRSFFAIIVCGFIMITFAMLPSGAKDIAARKYEVAKNAKKEVAKVEEVEEELNKELNEELSQEETLEYQETLKNIISELKDADTKEDIDKSLERAKTKLEKMKDTLDNKNAKDRISQLAKELDEDRIKNADGNAGNDVLASANLDDFEGAQEINGDNKDLDGNGQNPDDSNSDYNQENASESGEKSGSENGSGSGSENGNGNDNRNGNGSGDGSGNCTGNGNGNGTGSGNGQGGGWNYGSDVGQESDNAYGGDMVSIPNETGDDENLTGKISGDTSYLSKGGQSLLWSGKQVEYSSVFGKYKKKALSTVENGSYPSGVQDIIKSYFEKISN